MLTYVEGMFIKTANFRHYRLALCLMPYALCLMKIANFRLYLLAVCLLSYALCHLYMLLLSVLCLLPSVLCLVPLIYAGHVHKDSEFQRHESSSGRRARRERRYSLYLLYWYKITCFTGTNTDAEVASELGIFLLLSVELDASGCCTETAWEHLGTQTLLALLVQKYKY